MDIEPEAVDISEIKQRSIKGVTALIGRSFIQRLISSVGFFYLSVYLGQKEIGMFAAINALVSILGYFSDVGLAASIIQKKETVENEELRATFTLQQLIVSSLIILTLIFSKPIFSYYQLESSGQFLFFSLLFAFFMASLKTIPSVLAERNLRFDVLSVVELVETTIFYLAAVYFSANNYGASAYAVAVIVRAIIGTGLLYKIAPWNIGISFSFKRLKHLLTFGIPFQINSLLAVAKDQFISLALWKIIGDAGLGIIGWAQSWAQLPLRFVMDNVTKVTFPAQSRLQHDPHILKKSIEKTIFFISFLTFPIVAGLAIVSPLAIKLIPGYEAKWGAALVPLSLYCFNSAMACVSTPLTNTLNALGKVKINTYLMIMWTVLTWGLTPILAIKYGYMGVAYATGIIALSSFVPIIITKNLTKFSLKNSILPPLAGTIVLIVCASFLTRTLPASWPNIGIIICASGLVYLSVNLLFLGEILFKDIQGFAYEFRKRKSS